MKNRKIIALLVLCLSAIVSKVDAQTKNPKHLQFSVEIDPATFAFKGYSLHLRMQPVGNDHLLLGVGTYAMDMPDVMVNLNEMNKEEGWEVRLNKGYSFFTEHHFSEVNRKWFIGGQAGIQQFKIKNDQVTGNSTFTNALLMGYFGYTLRPFSLPLYIKPWAGVGYTHQLSGSSRLEQEHYDVAPMTMFATLHVGYSF